jgi:DnaJ-class molecular chaperone
MVKNMAKKNEPSLDHLLDEYGRWLHYAELMKGEYATKQAENARKALVEAFDKKDEEIEWLKSGHAVTTTTITITGTPHTCPLCLGTGQKANWGMTNPYTQCNGCSGCGIVWSKA